MASVDQESEELVSVKRRKTDDMDEADGDIISISDNSIVIEENDDDAFLQDYLSKRPQNNVSLYQKATQEEEREAKDRDANQDLKLYQDACADFLDCVADIAEVKASKPEGWKEKVNDLRKEGSFITIIMKKLNRIEKTRTKISREKLIEEKQQVDKTRIKLDNMLSEIQHLQKEISKCLKFRSKPLGIDLVSVNEFFQKAPTSISKPETTKTDDHQLQLARLEWELKQRKELAAMLNNLEKKKSVITEQIEKKEKDLDSIVPLVNDVLNISQPLKEKLGSSLTKNLKINEQAYLLPDPLYFLYVQTSAFADVSDKDISLEIKGNFLEAQKFKKLYTNGEIDASILRDILGKKCTDIEKSKLILKHPLSVHLKFSVKGYSFDLGFLYYPILNIATLKPATTVPSGLKIPSSSDVLLNPKNFFHELFPGDSGLESPNLTNYYQIQKVGFESLPLERMGLPYIWVQKLVGLNFIGQNQRIEPKQEVCRSSLPVILRELKRRCNQRLSLLSIVEDLEQGNVLPPADMKTVKVMAQLNQIKGITVTEYNGSPISEPIKNSAQVSPLDLHFKTIVTRGDAKMSSFIAVKPEHPQSPSIFSIKLECPNLLDERLASKFSLEIEKEVNIFWKDHANSRGQTSLSHQLFTAIVCFDIVLESLDGEAFPSSKQLDSTFSGRTRSLPFQYSSEENKFYHRSGSQEETTYTCIKKRTA